ncbi:invasin domain 3-containing protein [Paenibacillus azoreducens]|uniref:Uncharacterized protein n=1 Tax=Paenibacillus azoreducens TaxID=116718 RepID=A0A919YEY1_9BACL|nr:invasin domain 3-containing protein [Paenibacillus azoreducens]GIO48413.1 hypothetical protein J34TS1_31780 [Paenibacillus azoreducens]
MKVLKQGKRWTAALLIIALIVSGLPWERSVFADDTAVLDQEQTKSEGNGWVNRDYPKYQTFTPSVTGKLGRIELNIFDSFGATGALRVVLYKEGDLSKPLGSAELASFGSGWATIDFSGESPYLKRNTMYRMVVSTEFGQPSGFGWYMAGGDPYKGGSSAAPGYDFAFKTYMVPDYSLSPAESGIASADSSLAADGTSQTTITVKLKDAQGNDITSGAPEVAMTTTAGAISAVTNHHNGTYTATLTAPKTVGTATISASIDGQAMEHTASVRFVPGPPSLQISMIEMGAASLPADGTSQTPVAVKLKDAQGNDVTSAGAVVAITSTAGTVSAVTDNKNGTYTAILTAPTKVGTATVSASISGQAMEQTASVQFLSGPPSLQTSMVEAADSFLPADGTSQTAISVKLKDAQGNDVTSGGTDVVITATAGIVSAVTDNQNGTYTAILTAPTTVGAATISASIGGQAVEQTANVQFVSGEVSASHSTMTASDLVVQADGSSKASITVKLNDEFDHPLAGKRVLLQDDGGRSVIHEVNGVTDENGLAIFEVTNTAAENVTFLAKEETSGVTLDQTVSIKFTYEQPPGIELQADPVTSTFESVTVTVKAAAYGEFNSISAIKWAEGNHPVSYFETEGTEIENHFTVQQNGIFSIYVRDAAGNANVSLIEIANIVPRSSNANLAFWQLTGVGGLVNFKFDPEKTNYSVGAAYPVHGVKMILKAENTYAAVSVNGVEVNGGTLTDEYPLQLGSNKFEVEVKAQDGSIKTYTLTVVRSAESTEPGSNPNPNPNPGPGPSPNSGPSSGSYSGGAPNAELPSNTAPSGNPIAVWINEQKVSGIASRQPAANGTNFTEVLLDIKTIKKVLDARSAADSELSVSIANEPGKVAFRIPVETAKLLGEKAVIMLKTKEGQYRLPLAEVVKQEPDWTKDGEVQITIEPGQAKAVTGLQKAADQGDLQLVGEPVLFHMYVQNHGSKKEVPSFKHFVERVVYLPGENAKVSTAAVWDPKQGIRPVPTKFIKVDGRQAAFIHSFTNGAFVLIYKTPKLTDIQGHWAAADIEDMNSRMIVQGIDGSRFAPEAVMTRAELAALLARSMGLPEKEGGREFQDVTESSWYSGAIEAMKANGMMDGFKDGAIKPNQPVSRQEAIVMIVRAMQLMNGHPGTNAAGVMVDLERYTDHDQISNWASEAIRIAIDGGLVKGDGNALHPQKPVTRAETTALLYRMLLKAGFIDGDRAQ